MGEEVKQADKEKAEEAEKVEGKKEEDKEDKAAEEDKKPNPPSPLVLFLDLHCVGCARKIENSIMKIRGVEGVVIDMALNQVTIKGTVEPQAVCNKIMKKTKRRAKVLSPLPESEGETLPQVVTTQVSGSTTVELNINMHCVACAEQLKRKILRMRGVQTAVTEFNTGKVTVTGTMDPEKLVDYVYRRTKKKANIVPQPKPEQEPEKKEEDKKKEEEKPKPEEEKEEKKEEEKPQVAEEPKKEGEGENKEVEDAKKEETNIIDEENIKRMMYNYHQSLYVIERIPPPELFSDENPNACSIS